MRYLIESEFRAQTAVKARSGGKAWGSVLRRELSARNILWASGGSYEHELSLGAVPAVLYREDEAGVHGNFMKASYCALKANADWARRLDKVHTSSKRAFLVRDRSRYELDSSNSSDALLMNIFCHPATLRAAEVQALLAIGEDAKAIFGFRPRIPLKNAKRDTTEIDLRLGNLFVEAKLTESDFQIAPVRLLARYRDFEETFDSNLLEIEGGHVRSYQLIRGILAVAPEEGHRFCVLCDARRPDLIDAWHRVMMAVKPYDLRCRLQLLTWQELAMCLQFEIQQFLQDKFGIFSMGAGSGSM